jgi:hypothetical protein
MLSIVPSTDSTFVMRSPVRFVYLGLSLLATILFASTTTEQGGRVFGATLTIICVIAALRSVHAGTCSVFGGNVAITTLFRTRRIPVESVAGVSRAHWTLANRCTCPRLELMDGSSLLLKEFSNYPSRTKADKDRTERVIHQLASAVGK